MDFLSLGKPYELQKVSEGHFSEIEQSTGIDQRIYKISLERISFLEISGLKFILKSIQIIVETTLVMWKCITIFFITIFSLNKSQAVSLPLNNFLDNPEKKEGQQASSFNKIDQSVFDTLIKGAYDESDLLENEIKKLKLEDLKDLKRLNRLNFEVSENQKQADELLRWNEKMKIAGSPLFQLTQVLALKRVKSRFVQLYKMLGSKSGHESEKNTQLECLTPEIPANFDLSPAGIFSILFDWIEDSGKKVLEPLTKPPQFKNEYKRCWMHAALQLLLADDQFLENGLLKHPGWVVPKALRKMKEAIETGLIWNTDNASRSFHAALVDPMRPNASIELIGDPYSQKDAVPLFETVLADLEYQITLRRVLRGVGEQVDLSTVFSEKESILKISMKSGITTFQDAVNDHFSLQEIEDPQNVWCKDGISIPKRVESIQLVVEKDQEVPENLFVQLVRFVKIPEEILQAKLETRELKVRKIAAELRSKNPKFYDSESFALMSANEKVPDVDRCMKDDNPLFFMHESKKFLIDFSKAFQAEAGTYVYELYGVIYQQGSMNQGHYTADVLRSNGDNTKWYQCDDIGRRIREVDSEKVKPENGYFFAFKRYIKENLS